MDANIIEKSSLTGQLSGRQSLSAHISGKESLSAIMYRGLAVPHDYERLTNKPKIESVELIGNRSLEEIGVDHISNAELAALLD